MFLTAENIIALDKIKSTFREKHLRLIWNKASNKALTKKIFKPYRKKLKPVIFLLPRLIAIKQFA